MSNPTHISVVALAFLPLVACALPVDAAPEEAVGSVASAEGEDNPDPPFPPCGLSNWPPGPWSCAFPVADPSGQAERCVLAGGVVLKKESQRICQVFVRGVPVTLGRVGSDGTIEPVATEVTSTQTGTAKFGNVPKGTYIASFATDKIVLDAGYQLWAYSIDGGKYVSSHCTPLAKGCDVKVVATNGHASELEFAINAHPVE